MKFIWCSPIRNDSYAIRLEYDEIILWFKSIDLCSVDPRRAMVNREDEARKRFDDAKRTYSSYGGINISLVRFKNTIVPDGVILSTRLE